MNRSLLKDLYFKAFQSGNPIFLLMGINILVFLLINLIAVTEFLSTGSSPVADQITTTLSVPSELSEIPLNFWTIITYMFVQRSFFHILFNMLWLFWMGQIFMDFLNKRQFYFTYVAGGILGALTYLIAYNTIPVFTNVSSYLLGSSASVMAIVVATATLVPDYTLRLLLFGSVKLKYLAIAYFVLDIIGMGGGNAGGSIAHIGGAIAGFIFVKQLQSGRDLSKILKRKTRLKVVKNDSGSSKNNLEPDQETIDRILDKISKSGYDSLTKTEKEQLFKASKK